MTEKSWKCVRLVLDRSREKGVVRIDSPTYEQLLAENVGFEDFVESIKTDVDDGIVYDDSEHEIGGIVVLYLPFGEINVTPVGRCRCASTGSHCGAPMRTCQRRYIGPGGPDCGCGDPGCVENAYLRYSGERRGISETQSGHERATKPEGLR